MKAVIGTRIYVQLGRNAGADQSLRVGYILVYEQVERAGIDERRGQPAQIRSARRRRIGGDVRPAWFRPE
jgi:hypothetical protein